MSGEDIGALADEIESSNGLVLMLPGPRFGTVQLGIKKTAQVVEILRDRRKYSLLESQFENCHKEIRRLREALMAVGASDKVS